MTENGTPFGHRTAQKYLGDGKILIDFLCQAFYFDEYRLRWTVFSKPGRPKNRIAGRRTLASDRKACDGDFCFETITTNVWCPWVVNPRGVFDLI